MGVLRKTVEHKQINPYLLFKFTALQFSYVDKLRKQIDKMIPRDKIALRLNVQSTNKSSSVVILRTMVWIMKIVIMLESLLPDYLQPDPWFGDPILSEKSQELREADVQRELTEASMKQQVTKEPDNIHEVMYNMAQTTVRLPFNLTLLVEFENFQGGPNGYGWMSGKGVDLTPHVV